MRINTLVVVAVLQTQLLEVFLVLVLKLVQKWYRLVWKKWVLVNHLKRLILWTLLQHGLVLSVVVQWDLLVELSLKNRILKNKLMQLLEKQMRERKSRHKKYDNGGHDNKNDSKPSLLAKDSAH